MGQDGQREAVETVNSAEIEIARRLAKMDPYFTRMDEVVICFFCEAEPGQPHGLDCLWNEARTAVAQR